MAYLEQSGKQFSTVFRNDSGRNKMKIQLRLYSGMCSGCYLMTEQQTASSIETGVIHPVESCIIMVLACQELCLRHTLVRPLQTVAKRRYGSARQDIPS